MIRPVEATGHVPVAAEVPVAAAGAESREPASFRSILVRMRAAEQETDRWLARVMDRGLADPQELLRLQVVVHRFQHQVELASRVVEQVNQGIRTLTRPT